MTLKQRLIEQISHAGPITVADYMAQALHDPRAGYYATRPGLGADFITAPEISQMFGELIGLWCAHEWQALGAPNPIRLIELGPGSGALMRNALRAAQRAPAFTNALDLHLIEASPILRAQQHTAFPHAHAHANLSTFAPAPTLLIANELLDCLPIRQFVRTEHGWCERLIGARGDDLAFGLAPTPLPNDAIIPPDLRNAPPGTIAEIAPAAEALIADIATRLAPGRALFIDYGSQGGGDTFQALRAHTKVDPLASPGEADLTAHVDFNAIAAHARVNGLDVHGPIPQRDVLRALGLDQRAQSLADANPADANIIANQHARLTAPDQMGVLFQAICLSSPGLPPPAGF